MKYKLCSRCRIQIPFSSKILKCDQCISIPKGKHIFQAKELKKKIKEPSYGSPKFPRTFGSTAIIGNHLSIAKAARQLNLPYHQVIYWVNKLGIKTHWMGLKRILNPIDFQELREKMKANNQPTLDPAKNRGEETMSQ